MPSTQAPERWSFLIRLLFRFAFVTAEVRVDERARFDLEDGADVLVVDAVFERDERGGSELTVRQLAHLAERPEEVRTRVVRRVKRAVVETPDRDRDGARGVGPTQTVEVKDREGPEDPEPDDAVDDVAVRDRDEDRDDDRDRGEGGPVERPRTRLRRARSSRPVISRFAAMRSSPNMTPTASSSRKDGAVRTTVSTSPAPRREWVRRSRTPAKCGVEQARSGGARGGGRWRYGESGLRFRGRRRREARWRQRGGFDRGLRG